jgi:hypothetical protein
MEGSCCSRSLVILADAKSSRIPEDLCQCSPFRGASRDTRVPRVRTRGHRIRCLPRMVRGRPRFYWASFLWPGGVTRVVGPESSHPPRFFSSADFSRVIQGSSGFVTEHEKGVGSSQQTVPPWVTNPPKSVSIRPTSLIFGPFSPILRATRRFPQWPRKSLARTVHRPDRAPVPFEYGPAVESRPVDSISRWIDLRIAEIRAQGAVPRMPKISLRGEIQ